MAATWKLLPVQRFQNSKLQEEIICSPILADFARILTCSQDKILGVDHKDLLNIAVALYGNNLPEMSADTLFPVLTKKGVKTLLILKGNLAENFSCCTRSATSGRYNDKGNNGKQDLSECGSNVLADKDESDQTLGEFSDIFSDSSDTDEASSEESDNDADFSSEFEKFVEKVRARKDKPDDGKKLFY
ncbi:uncharacterized protein LOC135694946 [Rhopilema esculentum]|uniref:uncharacterized protein LOC135694946 n=1 Tax=Rhopilema esculentum TaxID=499914 RepID=UPI0031DA86C7